MTNGYVMRILIGIIFFVFSFTALSNDNFSFAIIGDNPYSDANFSKYGRLIDQVNSNAEIEWVIHLGDVKGGQESCSDQELLRRFNLNQRFNAPLIVTPGDNDWLDCKREGAGGYDEYERLEYFRSIFYPNQGLSTGGRPMEVLQQSEGSEYPEFVENTLWEHESIVFAAVHIVALTEPATDPAQKSRRDSAASAWIRNAFRVAKESDANGIFLAVQADPWILSGPRSIARRLCGDCVDPRPTLAWLYPILVEESIAFDKPVMFSNGSTHVFRIDKPLYDERNQLVENFTRLEGFGNPSVHWVSVLVEPDKPWVFSIRERLVE